MGTKHIANDGPNTIYVGGKMIPPGEGRDIDERDLPAELREPQAVDTVEEAPSLVDLVGALRAKSVDAIKGELQALTQEALDLLSELENAAKQPRKGLLAALGDEHIRRADDSLKTDNL
jgi:hypothetical protein